MTIQNFDSLFAINVRAPYFSPSSSCEPQLGSSLLFLTLGGGSCGRDQPLSLCSHQGRGRNLGQAFAFILGQHGSGVWNGAVSRRLAIVAFCKQPEDVQEAARLRRVRQRCGSRPTMRPGRGSGSYSEERHFGARSCQVWRRRRVIKMERCIPLARLFPATVANVTQFLRAEILL